MPAPQPEQAHGGQGQACQHDGRRPERARPSKGAGGSLGVEFLKQSLFHPIFPDLWAIRHNL